MTRATALYRLYETFKCKGMTYEFLEGAFDKCMEQKDMTEIVAYFGLKHGMGQVLRVPEVYTYDELADICGMSETDFRNTVDLCRDRLAKADRRERHKLRKQEPYKTLIKNHILK